jgi:hypothetical protein
MCSRCWWGRTETRWTWGCRVQGLGTCQGPCVWAQTGKVRYCTRSSCGVQGPDRWDPLPYPWRTAASRWPRCGILCQLETAAKREHGAQWFVYCCCKSRVEL